MSGNHTTLRKLARENRRRERREAKRREREQRQASGDRPPAPASAK